MGRPIILCVDDEKTVLNGLRDELKFDFGAYYSIELAESGEEALSLIEDILAQGESLPVIVSDQIMPGMKGDELLIAVHHRLPYTRKILLTGQASPDSVGNLVNHGALFRYIAKPWDQKDLCDTIREAIAEYEYDLKHKDDEQLYARRIQQALLPEVGVLKRHFPQSFILYQAAPMVAGDFYWFAERDDQFFLCVADATGRGIPGAYLSTLGVASLNHLLHYGTYLSTADIVNGLERRIAPQVQEINNSDEIYDGIELSLCRFDHEDGIVEFTGAKHDLYCVRGGKLLTLEGKPQPVARIQGRSGSTAADAMPYPAVVLELQPGDTFYLFTDGIAQQPGGKSGNVLTRGRLLEMLTQLADKPFEQQEQSLRDYIKEWHGEKEQRDDWLLICVKI